MVDGNFEDEFFCDCGHFAHFENFYFADPVKKEGLDAGKDQNDGLQFAEEDCVSDVGHDEDISFFDDEL